MRVGLNTFLYTIKKAPKIKFGDKKNEQINDGIFGFDGDLDSNIYRNRMRNDILAPVYCLEEKITGKALAEYINRLSSPVKTREDLIYQYNKLSHLNIRNLCALSANGCYRGSVIDAGKHLEELKAAGIQTMIFLCDVDKKIIQKCDELGLDYINFNVAKKSYNRSKTVEKRIISNMLLKTILSIKNKSCFIGCEWGTMTTDTVLFSCVLLCPQKILHDEGYYKHLACSNTTLGRLIIGEAYRFYRVLSEKDKIKLDYTPEFEEKLQKKFAREGFSMDWDPFKED